MDVPAPRSVDVLAPGGTNPTVPLPLLLNLDSEGYLAEVGTPHAAERDDEDGEVFFVHFNGRLSEVATHTRLSTCG